MILSGRSLIPRIISNLRSAQIQAQPCEVDLTLKHVKTWTSPGVIDFDNSQRRKATTVQTPFVKDGGRIESVLLRSGSYLVEFNESVDVPLDLMGQIFVRNSLFRSGALLSAGVMDSGYRGAVGAMLQVMNPHGLILHRNARLAQMVFHQMSEPVLGYSGTYQDQGTV